MTKSPMERHLGEIARVVQTHLGQQLVGLYLHGSAASGSFSSVKSDIDLLAVVQARPSTKTLMTLGKALDPKTMSHPFPLDLHIVIEAKVGSPNPRWEAWYGSHAAWGEFRTELEGADDRDLFLMFEVCRRYGRTLIGPEATSMFLPVPLSKLLLAADDNLAMWESFECPRVVPHLADPPGPSLAPTVWIGPPR